MSEGGPFSAGHILSVAFSTPPVARLLPHATSDEAPWDDLASKLVPESISACVIAEAPPYAVGDVVNGAVAAFLHQPAGGRHG